jgi:PAS domain S-box-containing protein
VNATPLRIQLLVVDDDDVDRERVLRLLARSPLLVEAMEATSGAGALNLLREHEFDCIMLDNQLGDATGTELLPAIQRVSRQPCPVIMVTGAGNEALAVQSLQEGAADYLVKYQLNADSLMRAIKRALEHQRMRLELDELHQRLEQRVEEQAAAIRQSERDLRAILDHTPTVIGYWDADLRNRFGNRAYRRWLGIDPQTLPGRHLRDVVGPEQMARNRARIEDVLRGESQAFEQTSVAPDGVTPRHAQISYHPDIGDDGTVRGFYSAINDVTAIKRAQAEAEESAAFAEALFEHSPIGLGVFDEKGKCAKCNRALLELFGVAEQELIGQPLEALIDDDALALNAAARAALADGQPRHLELAVTTRVGSALSAACAWARIERGGHGQLLLAAQDMTEQRQAHDALVAARNAAEQAARTKSEFLANMSHEIRTPMNAVIGLSGLALEDDLPDPARSFIAKSHEAALGLLALLNDMLDYSKIEAGQLQFERLPMDLEQVVQRVVDLFAVRIEHKGLEFGVELAPDLPRLVLGDPLRLSQVLNNLVSNAVKFTDEGAIHLSVRRLEGHAPASNMLRFAVRDTGIGIAADRREVLFEAFSQADTSITRRFGGTGLGLAICSQLVAKMHGTIGVESALGVGSEFWFTARLDQAPLKMPEDHATELPGMQVLLVGPDPGIVQALVARLQIWKVPVQTENDAGQAAVAAASALADGDAFDAVLLDWGALGDAAPAAARELRRAAAPDAGVVVIGVAAAGARALPAPGTSEGAPDLVLTKPVLPSALADVLVKARRLRRRAADAGADPLSPARQRQRALDGLRLLLVEDHETNRLVAQTMLSRMGAAVVTAANGVEALAQLQAEGGGAVDAILMDLYMPSMDGLEATRRIRALPSLASVPVIGMTAAAMPEDRAQCLAAGMVGYVTKPVLVEQLLEVLMRCTGRQHRPGSDAPLAMLPDFDLSTLRTLAHDEAAVIMRMLNDFAVQDAGAAAEVASLLAAGARDAACRRLHDLRGVSGVLGALTVSQAALTLEQAVRGGQPTQVALARLFDSLGAAVAAIAAIDKPAAA